MSPQSFDVTYKVGLGNLTAFFGAWWKRTGFDRDNRRRLLLYSLVIFALLVFGMRSLVSMPHFWPENLGLLAVMVVLSGIFMAVFSAGFGFFLVFCLGPILIYAAQVATFTFGPMRKRTTQLRATATGVERTADASESRTKWHEFTAVIDTKTTMLLFTNRNSATIVPKSAFASPAEAEAFATFAKAQWDEARSVF